jgi:hypothetical protein
MPVESASATPPPVTVEEVLLAYLRAVRVPLWPGADGLTLADVLASYPAAVRTGQAPDLHELWAEHPELAAELARYLPADEGPPS